MTTSLLIRHKYSRIENEYILDSKVLRKLKYSEIRKAIHKAVKIMEKTKA